MLKYIAFKMPTSCFSEMAIRNCNASKSWIRWCQAYRDCKPHLVLSLPPPNLTCMLYVIRVPCQGARNLTYLWDLMRYNLVKYANLDFSDTMGLFSRDSIFRSQSFTTEGWYRRSFPTQGSKPNQTHNLDQCEREEPNRQCEHLWDYKSICRSAAGY